MYAYVSACLLPCIVLVASLEDVTVGTITLPKNVTPEALTTEPMRQNELGVTRGWSPLPTMTHAPLHTVEQRRMYDPEIDSVEGDIERRRLFANRRRIERLRGINRAREGGSSENMELREWMDEFVASSGREEEIKRYLQLRDRYEPLVRLMSSRRRGSSRGQKFRSWLDQMVSKFGRDWDIPAYVDHGVWWEPLAALIFGTETMEDQELEEGRDWWYPRSRGMVSDRPSDWEAGDRRSRNGDTEGEELLERDTLRQLLRDLEAEERQPRTNKMVSKPPIA